MSGGSNKDRLVRVESKLTRLMLGMGFDSEGNPASDLLVVDKQTTTEIIDTLDLYLKMMDNLPDQTKEIDEQYSKGEALYNRLIDARRGRWPNR